jgi:hypothetical protein
MQRGTCGTPTPNSAGTQSDVIDNSSRFKGSMVGTWRSGPRRRRRIRIAMSKTRANAVPSTSLQPRIDRRMAIVRMPGLAATRDQEPLMTDTAAQEKVAEASTSSPTPGGYRFTSIRRATRRSLRRNSRHRRQTIGVISPGHCPRGRYGRFPESPSPSWPSLQQRSSRRRPGRRILSLRLSSGSTALPGLSTRARKSSRQTCPRRS